MTFPGAKLFPGWHGVFLGMGQMLLGKTPPFPSNAETVPGNIHHPSTALGSWTSPTLKARLAQPGPTATTICYAISTLL